MAENKLPSGVGKKIVQALKKQAEIEIQPIPETVANTKVSLEEETPSEIYENVINDGINLDNDFSDFSLDDDITAVDLTESNQDLMLDDTIQNDFAEPFNSAIKQDINFQETESPMFEDKEMFNNTQTLQPRMTAQPQNSYSMPANVAVLKRLIMQLPQGVSKQTGAQIIRQTMEALGISMNSVLKEAQQGQDSITANAKACMTTIAEYRNNIKNLEKQVQDYKKQAIALNDLISLFVMTDKH